MGIRLTTKVDKISMKKYYLNIIKDKDQRIAELEQELAELKEMDNYHLRYELAGADETITNLKQQLAEKDIRIEELEGQFAYECECNKQLVELQKQLEKKQNTIDEINKEFVQAVHDWKTLCAEKDKEIEKLKSEIVKECKEHQDFIKEAKQITNQLKSNYQTQLAIQELEKTLNFIEDVFDKALKNCSLNNGYYDQILDFIDQQINELKGEK